jgi:hypothetical protein
MPRVNDEVQAVGHDITESNDSSEYLRRKMRLDQRIADTISAREENSSNPKMVAELDHTLAKLSQTLVGLNKAEISRKIDSLKESIAYYDAKQNIEADTVPRLASDRVSAFFKITPSVDTVVQTTAPPKIADTYNVRVCGECKTGEMVESEYDGFVICRECGCCRTNVIDVDTGNYKDVPTETSFYAYKRINHFKEILSQFQAKETTQIPDEIITTIQNQVKKERLTNDELTSSKTKEILKKLGYNKYYEHIPFIKDKLGIKPPVMDVELETTLCKLFNEIQEPYAKCCPNDRVNFLNYYYTIYKLCELLGQTQFLQYFPMLKDRDKRIEQDAVWKQICAELGWLFVPTE